MTRYGGDDGGGWALSKGPHPRIPMQKEQETSENSPALHSIPVAPDVSECFHQVNVYCLLALATWKHEAGDVPLVLDPTEEAHHCA